MGQLNLFEPKEKIEFAIEFLPLPKGYSWRFAVSGDVDPWERPTSSCLGVSVGHFVEAGLRLPLDPLLLELMNETTIPLWCFNLNVIRTVLSVSALNKLLDLNLGLLEIFYCFRIVPGVNDMWHFSSYSDSPEMVRCLPTSQKGICDKLVMISGGPIVPESHAGFKFPKMRSPMGKTYSISR